MANCVEGHSAVIMDRGGKRPLGPVVNLTKVQWQRLRDNMSFGMIRFEGDACSQNAEILNKARTHRHELVIFRGKERVWEGPLHRIATGPGYAEMYAYDVSLYLNFQPLSQTWDNSTVKGVSHSTEVTTRIGNIITYEMTHGCTMFFPSTMPNAQADVDAWVDAGGMAAPVSGGWNISIPAWEEDGIWPSTNIVPYLDIRHFPNEAQTAMKTVPYQFTVGAHLQNLARQNGIDYTVLGRKIIVWDTSRNLGILQTMTEEEFSNDVIVTEYGADHAQVAYSIGGDGSHGSALTLANLAFYGPWTRLDSLYNEDGTTSPTQTELNSQARRNTSGRSPAPIEVRIPDNSTIFLSPERGVNSLVPGVQVPLRATLNFRKLGQMQKIDSVTVTETAQSGETIQVTLSPATKPDSNDEET